LVNYRFAYDLVAPALFGCRRCQFVLIRRLFTSPLFLYSPSLVCPDLLMIGRWLLTPLLTVYHGSFFSYWRCHFVLIRRPDLRSVTDPFAGPVFEHFPAPQPPDPLRPPGAEGQFFPAPSPGVGKRFLYNKNTNLRSFKSHTHNTGKNTLFLTIFKIFLRFFSVIPSLL